MASKTKDYHFQNSEGEDTLVSICSFPARKGISMGRRLMAIVKPLGGSLKDLKVKDLFIMVQDPSGKKDKKGKPELVPSFSFNKLVTVDLSIGDVVTALFETADDDKIDALIFDLCQTTTVNGQDLKNPTVFDLVFTDEYKLLIQVIKQIILHCFSSFFVKGATG